MRGLALVVVVAACGGEAGVLLDVKTGDPSITSVEVFVAQSQTSSRMGMPPANSTKATQGTVYDTIDHTVASVGGDGRVRVLLQRGDVTDVPAILVLGLDANGAAKSYAVVTDPNGNINLPATHEVQLVVQLDPVTPTTIATARMPGGNGVRIARWSAESRGSDDVKGPCVALLEDASSTSVTGTFFGPQDDNDCDAAQPECDDAWYLRVKQAGKCATNMAPNVDTMDACRLGDSAACRDNVPSSMDSCVPQVLPAPVCVPAPICDQCSDLDPNCVAQNLLADSTLHIDCVVDAHTENTSNTTLCANRVVQLPLGNLFGSGYSCTGSSTFVNPMSPTTATMPDMPLASGAGPRVTFMCHQLQFVIDIADPALSQITNNMDTQGVILMGVGVPNMPATIRELVLPITVHTNMLGSATCNTSGMKCSLVPDQGMSPPDPIWHCSGT